MLWIKEVEMVDYWMNWNPRDPSKVRISRILNAGREDCFSFEQDHPEFPLQEEGQSGGAQSPQKGPISTRKTDRLHDLRLLSSDWRS